MRSRSSPVSEPLSATPVLSLEIEIEGNLVANRPSSGARVQQPAYRLELSAPRGFVKRLATRLDLDPTKRELVPCIRNCLQSTPPYDQLPKWQTWVGRRPN